MLDLGEVQPNATIRFVVKPDIIGFTFVLTNPDPLFGPQLTHLTGPSGPVVTDGAMAGKPLGSRGKTITAFAPEKATTVVAGNWEAVVQSGGHARVELRRAPPKPTSRSTLALDVFVPQGAKLTAAGSAVDDPERLRSDPRFQALLDTAFTTLERDAGIMRGPVRYLSAPSEAGRDVGASSSGEGAIALLPAQVPARTNGVRLLLVDGIVESATFLGFSPVRGSASKDDAVILVLDPKTTSEHAGSTLVHELGHYLGLFHTSEGLAKLGHDPLSDTPECGEELLVSRPNGAACPDRPNVMFPLPNVQPERPTFSPEQRTVLLGSPSPVWAEPP